MCQLNLYLIKNNVPNDIVLKSLQKFNKHGKAEKISDDDIYKAFSKDFNEYNIYICSAMHCDCGTIQGVLQSVKGFNTYVEYKNSQKHAQFNNFDQQEAEYNNLLNFLDDILKQTDKVLLYSFWQSDEPIVINQIKTISRKDLKIDDIAFLNYNDILIINKQ